MTAHQDSALGTDAHDRHRVHTAIRATSRPVGVALREGWTYRELLFFFVWRDVKVRYKQSIVGVGWSVIQPLALMAVFTLFFGRVAHISSNGVPRPLFYFAGLLPWTYFQQAVSNSTNSLVTSAALVSKVYFPRVLLPVSAVLSSLVDLAISLPLLVGMTALFVLNHAPHTQLGLRILFLPVPIALVVGTALASGIWLSALNARYRDVRYAANFALQFWMFVSPIAYASSAVPARWRFLYSLNPITNIVDGFRWSLTTDATTLSSAFYVSSAIVLAGIVLSLRYFRKWEGTVADVI